MLLSKIITKLLVKVQYVFDILHATERKINRLIRGDFFVGEFRPPALRAAKIKKPALKRAFERIKAGYIVIISFSFSAVNFSIRDMAASVAFCMSTSWRLRSSSVTSPAFCAFFTFSIASRRSLRTLTL